MLPVDHHAGDRRWIGEKLERLPFRFRRPLLDRYSKKYSKQGRPAANLFLLGISEEVAVKSWRLCASDDELVSWAERRAVEAGRIRGRVADVEAAYLYLLEFCRRSEVAPEETSTKRTTAGAVARMCCPLWWRRRVRAGVARRVEAAAINIGLVNDRAGLYSSDETVARRTGQRSRNRAMLVACQAINELGQEYTLAQLADLSVSNPVIRRGELMVRMVGFEQYAEGADHVGDFYTWTCPSRMHYSSSKYDGTTPRAAQQHLTAMWAKARAAMQRAGVKVYGFRVAEPHHDGCPHWHMLFFMDPAHRAKVREILKRYALEVDGDEQGATEHRFKVVEIDKRKGTAAGYLAKYVAKNIDGFGVGSVDEDLSGKRDPKECAVRVDAWASCWGIRQFQQVGGPAVTVWRELRRLDGAQECEEIERARAKADIADWCGFMHAQQGGGVGLARMQTGELNRYDEVKAPEIVGVRAGAVTVTTRVHQWKIERSKPQQRALSFEVVPGVDPLGIGFEGRGAAVAPWSPVNNCTGIGDEGKSRGFEGSGRAGKAETVLPKRGGNRGGSRGGYRDTGRDGGTYRGIGEAARG